MKNEDKKLTMSCVDEYLANCGYELQDLTTKQKLNLLKNILLTKEVDSDAIEILISKSQCDEERQQHLTKYLQTSVEIVNLYSYIGQIRLVQKIERKVKAKNKLIKFQSFVKKRK